MPLVGGLSVWGGVAALCGFGLTLLRSAPVQGVSRPPHAASRDCRTAHPSPVRTRVRLHRNTGSRDKRKSGKRRNEEPKNRCISVSVPTRSAASRAGMAGWAGEGGGRFGERREYEAPTLPSTPRQHGAARHHTRQARNDTPCQHGAARHQTRQPRNSTPPPKPGKKRYSPTPHPDTTPHQPQNTCQIKMSIADEWSNQFLGMLVCEICHWRFFHKRSLLSLI